METLKNGKYLQQSTNAITMVVGGGGGLNCLSPVIATREHFYHNLMQCYEELILSAISALSHSPPRSKIASG